MARLLGEDAANYAFGALGLWSEILALRLAVEIMLPGGAAFCQSAQVKSSTSKLTVDVHKYSAVIGVTGEAVFDALP